MPTLLFPAMLGLLGSAGAYSLTGPAVTSRPCVRQHAARSSCVAMDTRDNLRNIAIVAHVRTSAVRTGDPFPRPIISA